MSLPTCLRNRRTQRRSLIAIGLLVACAVLGCNRQAPSNRHEVLTGTVEALQADIGQLTVRVPGLRREPDDDQKVTCLLANDTEVYINDRFRSFDAIALGDTVELIGYRDPSPRAERFVVRLAYITRNEPLPSEPDLALKVTPVTTQPQESQPWPTPH
jgi:hypothetical protein